MTSTNRINASFNFDNLILSDFYYLLIRSKAGRKTIANDCICIVLDLFTSELKCPVPLLW